MSMSASGSHMLHAAAAPALDPMRKPPHSPCAAICGGSPLTALLEGLLPQTLHPRGDEKNLSHSQSRGVDNFGMQSIVWVLCMS